MNSKQLTIAVIAVLALTTLALSDAGRPRLVNPAIAEAVQPAWGFYAPRYQLVGFSTATRIGAAGVLGMTQACQTDFPESRMCTVDEVYETIVIPVLPDDGLAWIRGPEDCNGWSTNSSQDRGSALVNQSSVTSGGLVGRTCNSDIHVACCAPV